MTIQPPSLWLPGLANCAQCSISGEHVNTPVPGYGPRPNKVMIVAQAPGRVENDRAIPLIGPSGQFLADTMRELGMDLNEVYRTNINKCWPLGDRKARANEVRICTGLYLYKELEIVDPDIIIAMGDTAYRVFLPTEKSSITQIQGSVFEAEVGGRVRKIVPCVHPAFVLRNPEANKWMLTKALTAAKAVVAGIDPRPVVVPFRETEASWEEIEAALAGAVEFGFDLETTGLHRRSEVVGIGICTEPGNGLYYPTADNDDALNKLNLIRRYLEDPDITTIVTNAKFERSILCHSYGITMRGYEDTMLQAWILGDRPKSLKDGFHFEFGHEMQRITELDTPQNRSRDWRGLKSLNMRLAQARDRAAVVRYAAQDPDATLRLYRRYNELLRARPELYKLYKEVELPMVEAIVEMEAAGMTFDPARLIPFFWELEEYHQKALDLCRALAGREFNPHSPVQTAEVLYRTESDHQIPKPAKIRKGGSEYPTGKVDLAAHVGSNPLVRAVLTARGVRKLQSYVTSLPTFLDDDGRIHTDMQQAVASTGRAALRNPNLSNIPARKREDIEFDIEGSIIRDAFVAPHPDWAILAPDLSQIEMRIAAHLSGDERMISLLTDGDIHTNTTIAIYGQRYYDADPDTRKNMRYLAKTIGFGVLYGLTAEGLVARTPNLNLTHQQAQHFIDTFYRSYPRLLPWQRQVIVNTRKCGYATTILGRRRYLPDITSRDRAARAEAERQAVNVPVQGSAADYFKLCILGVRKFLRENRLKTRLINQVHDEIVMEGPKSEIGIIAAHVPEIMATAIPLKLPVKVDMEIGPTWGNLKKISEWKDISTWQ